jgi:hypothetical protein
MAGRTAVVLGVDERGTADAAMAAYRTQLADSQSKSKDTKGARDEQKTTPEARADVERACPRNRRKRAQRNGMDSARFLAVVWPAEPQSVVTTGNWPADNHHYYSFVIATRSQRLVS